MDSRLRKHRLGYYEIASKPTNKQLQEYYAKKYFQESRGSYEQEYSAEELTSIANKLKCRHAALKKIQNKINSTASRNFLDVGCGEGYAMAYFKNQGYQVKGFDFSSAGVTSKNPECIEMLTTGDLFELLDKEVKSMAVHDVVWLQNVLEHVIDPLELMNSLRNLVSPEGVAVITVPNDCSIIQQEALNKGYIDKPFWIMPPDHLTYFDANSLMNLANETRWSVVDMLADFPIDWYLYHKDSNYVMKPNAGEHAHLARIQLENLFSTRPIEDVVSFWRAMAKIGSGRNLTIFLTPS